MSDSTVQRFLFADYANGVISAEQLEVLEAAIRKDSVLRREFIEYLNLDSALGDLAALSAAEVAEIEAQNVECLSKATGADDLMSITRADPPSSGKYRVVGIAGFAATLLLAAIMWIAAPDSGKDVPVATLVTDVEASLLYEGQRYNGAGLHAGKYQLEQGLLHLQFDGGVMVYVEAPTSFDVHQVAFRQSASKEIQTLESK